MKLGRKILIIIFFLTYTRIRIKNLQEFTVRAEGANIYRQKCDKLKHVLLRRSRLIKIPIIHVITRTPVGNAIANFLD